MSLPRDITREHCEFRWWETEHGDRASFDFAMPAHNITLYAFWFCTHITTAEDLIDFSKNVNSGTSYYRTTVFLDANIDFSGGLSEQFE